MNLKKMGKKVILGCYARLNVLACHLKLIAIHLDPCLLICMELQHPQYK